MTGKDVDDAEDFPMLESKFRPSISMSLVYRIK